MVGTPHDIFEKIYRRLFIMKKFLYDDCPDNHECNQLDWFDLLLNDFIRYLNYVNPTFSKIAAVLVMGFSTVFNRKKHNTAGSYTCLKQSILQEIPKNCCSYSSRTNNL